MNKKGLSVVMAGAMLASSVAPVLAAPVEYGISQIKLVEKEVLDLVESGMISSSKVLQDAAYVDQSVIKGLMDGDNSIYGIKVLDENGKELALSTFDASLSGNVTYKKTEIEKVFAGVTKKLEAKNTIQVVERAHSKFLGQIIPGTEIKSTGVTADDKFETKDFATFTTLNTALADCGLYVNTTTGKVEKENGGNNVAKNAFVESVKLNDTNTGATITLNTYKNLSNTDEGKLTIEVKTGEGKPNFLLPLDKDGNLVTDSTNNVQNCVKFAAKETYQPSAPINSDPTVKAEYKLVDDSAKAEQVTLLSSDLYDGFALTAKGTEIQADVENAKKVAKETLNDEAKATVQLSNRPTALTDGVASFKVTYFDSYKLISNPDNAKKVVTVKSTNLKEIQSLHDMINRAGFKVGIVGGDNRYATAVNVAKQQGITKTSTATAKDNNDIVLVNGNSLVDGLAAAPLASALRWNSKAGTSVLLTKADSLPIETKEYLEELLVDTAKSNVKNVKIHLVGGESVLSEELVKELKEMGFSVVRHGGDNREETSLEVAAVIDEKAGRTPSTTTFVVGGNGEADAMSIAAVAASKKAPIIVSNVHGLTKDALKYVEKNKNDDVVIVGGESVVSATEYEKIDELTVEGKPVKRLAGKNRFETNAKVIEEYYKESDTQLKDSKGVVLVKDGQTNKDELVDALSAANYAITAGMKAPIVLASTSLKDVQKNALLNVDMDGTVPETAGTVVQVGIGAERTVLETIAGLFNISNVK